MAKKDTVWTRQTKLIVLIMLLLVGGFLLYTYSAVIPPILLAVFIAYVINPFANRLEKMLHVQRSFAILIIFALLFAVLGLILFVGMPFLFQQLRSYNIDTHKIFTDLLPLFQFNFSISGYAIQGSQILESVEQALSRLPETLAGNVLALVPQAFEGLLRFMLIIMISIYLVQDSKQVTAWFMSKSPSAYREEVLHLRDEIDRIWSSFFRGQLILALVVAAILTVEGYAIGLRFAPLMGILGGLLEFMPSIGHTIWFSLVAILVLVFGSTWLPVPNWVMLIIVACMHLIFTQFDLNYLIPRIIGRRVRLSPLVVLLGIVIGISIAGVWGVVLAAPTIATLRVIGRYIYGHLVDVEPMTETIEVSEPLPPPELRIWKRRPVRSDPRD